MHIRCLDALRAQGSANEKNAATRETVKQSSATDAPSLILLPYGIADSSDGLTDEDEDEDLNLRPKKESRDGGEDMQGQTAAGKSVNSKFRIKTGGKSTERHSRLMKKYEKIMRIFSTCYLKIIFFLQSNVMNVAS